MNHDRRTMVGGRSDHHRSAGSFPRGIELLLKKAKADPEFRTRFATDPEAAARSIELDLTPIESAMLQSMPRGGRGSVGDSVAESLLVARSLFA